MKFRSDKNKIRRDKNIQNPKSRSGGKPQRLKSVTTGHLKSRLYSDSFVHSGSSVYILFNLELFQSIVNLDCPLVVILAGSKSIQLSQVGLLYKTFTEKRFSYGL